MTAPPLTKDISSERMKSVTDENNIREIVPELPCHTQCVERYVKLVTNASASLVLSATIREMGA